jgi:hypothetical protein
MVNRWRSRSKSLSLVSHSAGIADIGRLPLGLLSAEATLFICGAPIPGVMAMIGAARASSFGGTPEPVRPWALLRDRIIPIGTVTDRFGESECRLTDDDSLRRYLCLEHIGVALTLMSSRVLRRQDWRDRRVVLVGSDGDRIAPPSLIRRAEPVFSALGAKATVNTLPYGLPHMFPLFESGAHELAALTNNDG